MSYTLEFRKEYLNKVNKFKEINWVKNHMELEKKPNFWSIIEYGKIISSKQRSSHETRSSKMLRWILDANENHNLGNIFAYKLMKKIDKNIDYDYSLKRNKHIKCKAEMEDIDIFYEDHDQNVLIAIELKQFTREHGSTGFDSQLDKYEDVVKNFEKKEKKKFHKIFVYLTPRNEEPSSEKWHIIGYKEIIEIIEEINDEYLSKSDDIYKSDTKKILYDFKDDLQRSIDILVKDHNYVMNNFLKEEIKFTSILAKEITGEGEGEYIKKLSKDDDNITTEDLKTVVLLINEYIMMQNHTPNNGVKLLMRKIFNYISEDSVLDLEADFETKFPINQRQSVIKSEFNKEDKLHFTGIELTRDSQQGINIYNKLRDKRIYFSGDTYGNFPNDSMAVRDTNKNATIIVRPDKVTNSMFTVDYEDIEKDEITINKKDQETSEIISEVISFDDFMESYLMKEIESLNYPFKESE